MNLEPCFKVHNLVVIQLNRTKLGQMTPFINKIYNSSQSPGIERLECLGENFQDSCFCFLVQLQHNFVPLKGVELLFREVINSISSLNSYFKL